MIGRLLLAAIPAGLVLLLLAHVSTLLTAIEHAIRILPR
jgi:hypothetical protein